MRRELVTELFLLRALCLEARDLSFIDGFLLPEVVREAIHLDVDM
jgi:hypothetical protein